MDTTTPRVRPGGKRQRLVEGAAQVFYEQGVERTTLADVAARTDIPVGNIYYYFKTKSDLVDAVVSLHSQGRRELITRLERRRTPLARLVAFLDELDATRTAISDFGCPVGTLSSELNKQNGTDPSPGSQELLGSMIDWAEQQFREMGQRDPRDLATTLIATYEGATILTHTLRDPNLMHRQSLRLRRWLQSLQSDTPSGIDADAD